MSRERALLFCSPDRGVRAGAARLVGEASRQRPLARLSNGGREVPARQTAFARRAAVHHVSCVGTAAAYYRFDRATGPASVQGRRQPSANSGAWTVRAGLPDCRSSSSRLLDLRGDGRGTRDVSLFRAEGFAADGVSSVAFLRPNGKVAFTVPVHGNVFATTAVPKGPIKGLAADRRKRQGGLALVGPRALDS